MTESAEIISTQQVQLWIARSDSSQLTRWLSATGFDYNAATEGDNLTYPLPRSGKGRVLLDCFSIGKIGHDNNEFASERGSMTNVLFNFPE